MNFKSQGLSGYSTLEIVEKGKLDKKAGKKTKIAGQRRQKIRHRQCKDKLEENRKK